MIKDDMKFIGYINFYKMRYAIKYKYNNLSKSDKVLYKYYVYSRRQLREYTCDLIWCFLNDDEFITDEIMKSECAKYRM